MKKYTRFVKVIKNDDTVILESSDCFSWTFSSSVNAENAMVLLLASTMQAFFEDKTIEHDYFKIELIISEDETS